MRRAVPFSLVGALFAVGCSDALPLVEADAGPTPPGPAALGRGVRVFSGTAATLSSRRSCTAAEGEDDDRWCAFVGLGPEGEHNLFVVNVSAVVAGVAVSCDAPDPNCLLLANHVEGSTEDLHPTFFGGDTLVYYDRGLIPYAWRPEWQVGRLLASGGDTHDMLLCTPAPDGKVVACLAMPLDRPDPSIVLGELYAGAAEGASEPLLEHVDTVIAATSTDTDQVHRFGFGAYLDGHVAWSSRATADGEEVLKLSRADAPANESTVASDVHKWQPSADGRSWSWLRATNGFGVGTLQTAPFPSGEPATDLLDGVYAFKANRSGSLVALTYERRAVSIPDPVAAPDEQVLLDGDVSKLVALSDQGHVAYAKSFVTDGVGDLVVSSLDGQLACGLEPSASVLLSSVFFSSTGKAAVFARSTADGFDAYHARLADCGSTRFASAVVMLAWLDARHAVFVDDFDPERATGSLRVQKLGHDDRLHPDAPTLIAEQAGTIATLGPGLLLYVIQAGTDDDGAYVRALED
jgi:hypothetical protein